MYIHEIACKNFYYTVMFCDVCGFHQINKYLAPKFMNECKEETAEKFLWYFWLQKNSCCDPWKYENADESQWYIKMTKVWQGGVIGRD